jgi:DNA primase
MSGRIPRSFIDDLLLRADIVDLIDSFVPLKKSGNNYVARCPFHTEKTPSFSVNRNKQFFYCFGCGASGNAIGFLMDYSHLGFVEAVEDLASFVGIDVPKEAGEIQVHGQQQDLGAIYELLHKVTDFYVEQLRVNPDARQAVEYLKDRGVSGEVARDFALGYAPNDWRALTKQFDQKLLLEAGLLGKGDTGKVYDRFRGRVMFPISDRRGRVVGFGGRVVDNSLPKYLNSPETPVFQKGLQVYGLYELLKRKSKPQRIIVVEGYMDVIALVQYGVNNVVAALGTATSKAHLDLLYRFAAELVFCFDGDAAGRQAAWRAVEVAFPCLKEGRQLRVMLLPQGYDPDSLVREMGGEYFVEQVASSITLSDYFFQFIAADLNLADIEGRARLVEKVQPYLEKLPNGVFRDMMYARLKELAKLESMTVVETATAKWGLQRVRGGSVRHKISPARTAIALLLQYPELAEVAMQKNLAWADLDFPGIPLLVKILQRIEDNPRITFAALVEGFRGLPEEKYVNTLKDLPVLIPEGVKEEFAGALDRLVGQARENKLEALIAKMESEGLDQGELELWRKLNELGAKDKAKGLSQQESELQFALLTAKK